MPEGKHGKKVPRPSAITNYDYKNLAVDKEDRPEQFRLLTLLAGAGDDRIECLIEHHPLPGRKEGSDVQYEALSWTWGDEDYDDAHTIWIKTKEKGYRYFHVRQNLWQALKYLRGRNDRVIWVDFVCIHQGNDDEKNSQVQFIFDIYRKADNVCVWLGEHDEDSRRAVEFIRQLVDNVDEFEHLTEDKNTAQQWKSLASMMHRPWFSRRWVVQELALAKQATIYCGNSELDWDDFESAVSLFDRDVLKVSDFYKVQKVFNFSDDYFGDIGQMGATRLVNLRSNLFRFQDDDIQEYRYNLSDLVSHLWSFDAKEPHDLIYAILSLARDTWSRMRSTQGRKLPTTLQLPGGPASNPSTPSATTPASEEPPIIVVSPVESTHPELPAAMKAGQKRKSEDERSDSATPPLDDKDRQQEGFKKQRTVGQGTEPSEASEAPATGVSSDEHSAMLAKMAAVAPAVRMLKSSIESKKTQRKTIFEIDYKQPFFAVCKQFLGFVINKTQEHNLDIILRPWAPQTAEIDSLPSWVPCVSNAAFDLFPESKAPGGYRTKRINADPLVGQTTLGSRGSYYNACGPLRAMTDDWGFVTYDEKDKRMLVRGFVLDQVDQTQDASQNGTVIQKWLKLARVTSLAKENGQAIDALWRTLIGDRALDGNNTKGYYRKIFQSIVDVRRGINTSELKRGGHPVKREYLTRMEAVVWNRRLFRGKLRNNLGLAPEAAKDGDYICIFRGASVPVVVRPTNKDSNVTDFEIIGACYLHTMMDGRAIDVREARLKELSNQKDSEEYKALEWKMMTLM